MPEFAKRTALVITATVWTLCLSFAVLAAALLVSRKVGHRLHRLWGRGICFIYGIRVDIVSAFQIPEAGGAVLIANHQSMFDIPILACLPVDFKWVSKHEVRRVPLLGWGMRAMGCFFVTRRDSTKDLNVLKSVEDGLVSGSKVFFFPEGTRSKDGELKPFKKGAFRVSQHTATPLCPIAIGGSFELVRENPLPCRRGFDVSVRVGAPLWPMPGEPLNSYIERGRKELVRLLEESSTS
jgi:1-acyl-sn-glycerol-3-phosphate acyltransferase